MRHWLETMHDCPEEEAHIESVEQFWGSRQIFLFDHRGSHSVTGCSLFDTLASAAGVLARTPAQDDSHQPMSHWGHIAHGPGAEQSRSRRNSRRGAG